MKLHLTGDRLDAELVNNLLQLGYGHIGDPDMTDKTLVHKLLYLSVGIHELLYREGL